MREWLSFLVFISEPLLAVVVPVAAVYALVVDLSVGGAVIVLAVVFIVVVTVLRPVALDTVS